MPENRFEKDVQQQMEELQLRPSEVVWVKVEAELRKKKKRRVVYFFFLFAALSLAGYTTYVATRTHEKKSQKEIASFPINNPADQTAKKNPIVIPEKNIDAIREKDNVKDNVRKNEVTDNKNEQSANKQNQTLTNELVVSNSSNTDKTKNIKSDNLSKVNNSRNGNPQKIKAKNTRTVLIQSTHLDNVNSKKKQQNQRQQSTEQQKPITAETADVVRENVPQQKLTTSSIDDSASVASSKPKAPIKTIDSAVTNVDTSTKSTAITKAAKKKTKIDWGIEASFGMTSRNSKVLPSVFEGEKTYDDPITPGNINASPGYQTYPPSIPRAGAAFQVGISARINLSSKNRILTGLNYSYQSDRISTGAYRDTSIVVNNAVSNTYQVAALYRVVGARDYVNSYHSIVIPIRFETQLTKGRLPLNWNVGVNVGYLFSSNALVYDTAARGIYYKDKAPFHKMHFAAASGVTLSFGKPNKMQWSIGPDFSIDMTKLVNSPYDKRQHLLYVGVTGRVYFKK